MRFYSFLIALCLLSEPVSMAGGVVDGQPVNAATVNAAYLYKNGNDTSPYTYTLGALTVTGLTTPTGGILGSTSGVLDSAGNVGETLTNTGAATAGTGAQATIATLTLTVGVWLVTGATQGDNNATQTGFDAYFYQKGVNGAVVGSDKLYFRYAAGQAAAVTFPARVLVVATADVTKTIAIKVQALTSNQDHFAYLSATRMP